MKYESKRNVGFNVQAGYLLVYYAFLRFNDITGPEYRNDIYVLPEPGLPVFIVYGNVGSVVINMNSRVAFVFDLYANTDIRLVPPL